MVPLAAAWTLVWTAQVVAQPKPASAATEILQPPHRRPTQQTYGRHRLIKRFTFEEAEQNNFEELPIHWYVIGRSADTANPHFLRQPIHQELLKRTGYPAYAPVRFDRPQREPGEHRLLLGLEGGRSGAFLEVGALPAVPESDYLVTAQVRTSGLVHANAALTAYFVDARGNKIDDSQVAIDPTRTSGEWQTVTLRLLGDYPGAAWIGMQVEARQPEATPDAPLGNHEVVYRDVAGGVWFDDITVWQVPRLVIRTQSPVNVIRAPVAPKLSMQVQDLTGRSLGSQVVLYDHHLNEVARLVQPIHDGRRSRWAWAPPLKKYGWYLADMTVHEPTDRGDTTMVIGRSLSALLWLPNESALYEPDAERFVIAADGAPEAELDHLVRVMEASRLRSVVVSAWDRGTTLANLGERQERLDNLIQSIMGMRCQVTMSLHPLPFEMAEALDISADSPLWAFVAASPGQWAPYLTPVLMTHGQRVRRWQFGARDDTTAFFLDDLGPTMQRIGRDFRDIAPDPRLVLPWSAQHQRRPELAAPHQFAVNVPQSVPAESIESYAEEWDAPPDADFWLHLNEPAATRMAHHVRIEDLAFRMIFGWDTGAVGTVLSRPWTLSSDRTKTMLPDPLLGVYSSVAHRLAGRRRIGSLPMGKGLECLIYDGPAGGMLAAWNRSASSKNAVIDMHIGPAPEAVDLWGNRSPVVSENGRHRIALGSAPVFIEGADTALALLRSTFQLDEPFIESTVIPHKRMLTLTNPWPQTITGYFRITEPADWTITPRQHYFAVAAGQSAQFPVQLRFPISEVAGEKNLVARFDFRANQSYEVDLNAPMELGLSYVDFDASLSLEPNDETGELDAIITHLITNTGPKPVALYAFASMQGYPRQERIVARLKSGQSVIRRFRFSDAGDKLDTIPIRAGVRETTGPAILNKVFTADDL